MPNIATHTFGRKLEEHWRAVQGLLLLTPMRLQLRKKIAASKALQREYPTWQLDEASCICSAWFFQSPDGRSSRACNVGDRLAWVTRSRADLPRPPTRLRPEYTQSIAPLKGTDCQVFIAPLQMRRLLVALVLWHCLAIYQNPIRQPVSWCVGLRISSSSGPAVGATNRFRFIASSFRFLSYSPLSVKKWLVGQVLIWIVREIACRFGISFHGF